MVMPLDEPAHHPLRHILVIWFALLGVLLGIFAIAIIAINATVFSASGFVHSYLEALQRGDVDTALSTAGVSGNSSAGTELLTPDALGAISEISVDADDDHGAGFHLVRYSATLGGLTEHGSFLVQKGPNRLGAFSTWSFVESPMSVLLITPEHDASFSVNGVSLTSKGGPDVASSYQVLTPGFFIVDHHSAFLTAEPQRIGVTRTSSVIPITLDIQASSEFVSEIQKQADDFLDACATQQVLFPSGCPFGQELSNRVEGTPQWSIVQYPEVTIEPGGEPGTWVVPLSAGAAHLVVDVRSLFDGTLSTFDDDVLFYLDWIMTIDGSTVTFVPQ